MIVGIGTDLVALDRIRRVLARHGEAFLARTLTPAEQALARDRRDPVPFVAGRWAAKEAVAKALGTGFGRECGLLDLEVLNDPAGRPVLALHGAAAATAARRGIVRVHLSLSHEQSHAVAFAVAEEAG